MRIVGVVTAEALTMLAGAEVRTLERVVRWVAPLGGDIVDIVVQDEYTHDVIVGVGGVYVVYDTT